MCIIACIEALYNSSIVHYGDKRKWERTKWPKRWSKNWHFWIPQRLKILVGRMCSSFPGNIYDNGIFLCHRNLFCGFPGYFWKEFRNNLMDLIFQSWNYLHDRYTIHSTKLKWFGHKCTVALNCHSDFFFAMKTPERSRTSHVGHLLVLSPQNSLHSVQLLRNEILPGDLDVWPTTLTYNPSLAKVMVNSHTKNQGHRSNGLAVRVLTDTHTDIHTERQLRFYDLDSWCGR